MPKITDLEFLRTVVCTGLVVNGKNQRGEETGKLEMHLQYDLKYSVNADSKIKFKRCADQETSPVSC